jgi:hypothetical protein
MARDDDDAVSEELMRRKDRDDDDQDLPRKKSSRDEESDDEDEDRPRKKKTRDDDEARGGKERKPMPMQLIAAIIASMAWGGYILHHNCGQTSGALIGIIQMEKRDREIRDLGFAFNRAFGFGEHKGFIYTMAGAEFFMMLLGAVLVAGGIALLMRKGFGKYLAMAAPAAMALVELFTFVVCLAITSGAFLTNYNANFMVNVIFSLAVGGCNAYMLLNKDVSKALK